MSAAQVAVLLAFAAGLALPHRRSTAARRLAALRLEALPGDRGDAARGLVGAAPRAPAGAAADVPSYVWRAAAAGAVVALLSGHQGGTVMLAVLAAALVLPAAHRRRLSAADRAAQARALPRAADLLAACLDAGSPPSAALRVVADAVGGPLGVRLRRVAAALRSGVDATAALPAPVGTAPDGDPVARLVGALARAATSGAPLAVIVQDLAADERERARWDALERARGAGVRVVGPLAACFLPAFVLVGVVPVVAGVARMLLGQLT